MKASSVIILFCILTIACCERKQVISTKQNNDNDTRTEKLKKSSREKEKELYLAVYRNEIQSLTNILSSNIDPNYCIGECGWLDSNPLSVIAEGLYDTYYRIQRGKPLPNPLPDVETLTVLLSAGADIRRRPYIWERVNVLNDSMIRQMKAQRKAENKPIDMISMQEEIKAYVDDANRLLEVFLVNGADPDMKGHPYPFSIDAVKRTPALTDDEAKKYFSVGSRAINIAIEKGSLWESQVDLLLRFTKLDEESLSAANRSNDPKMVKKIQTLWAQQGSDSR